MIRPFDEKDLSCCKKIIENCLNYSMDNDSDFVKFFREEFNDPNYFKLKSNVGGIFVFEEKGIIKGMGCADGNWIRKVFVEPKYQRRGIGDKIIKYLEETIKKNGYKEVLIYSYPNTKKLCLKKSFQILEEISFKRGNLEVKGIKMTKKI